jgi:hypothetical protein
MLKCCLLEFGIEKDGEVMVVPWGSDLDTIAQALKEIVSHV